MHKSHDSRNDNTKTISEETMNILNLFDNKYSQKNKVSMFQ